MALLQECDRSIIRDDFRCKVSSCLNLMR